MRGARNATVARDDNGQIYAISLGADFVAEHEWGIKQTYRSFGINPENIGKNPIGVDSRLVTRRPEHMRLTEHKVRKRPGNYSVGWKGVLLMMGSHYRRSDEDADPKELREMYDSPGRDDDQMPLSTAWSDGDFAIFARKDDEIQFLRDLDEAFTNLDVVIWLGGGGTFRNSGLCFGIRSRLPKEMIDEFENADNYQIILEQADAATGIKDRLKAAREEADRGQYPKPFGYFALSPQLINEEMQEQRGTTHPVIYWLNPNDQQNVNFGWFTVEELDQWIAGEGPCLEDRSKKSA